MKKIFFILPILLIFCGSSSLLQGVFNVIVRNDTPDNYIISLINGAEATTEKNYRILYPTQAIQMTALDEFYDFAFTNARSNITTKIGAATIERFGQCTQVTLSPGSYDTPTISIKASQDCK